MPCSLCANVGLQLLQNIVLLFLLLFGTVWNRNGPGKGWLLLSNLLSESLVIWPGIDWGDETVEEDNIAAMQIFITGARITDCIAGTEWKNTQTTKHINITTHTQPHTRTDIQTHIHTQSLAPPTIPLINHRRCYPTREYSYTKMSLGVHMCVCVVCVFVCVHLWDRKSVV